MFTMMSEEHLPIYSKFAGDEDLGDIIVLFVEEMPERIARFQKALVEKNWPELQVAAHQLKGSAGSHGFGTLSPIAAELEATVKTGQSEEQIAAATERLVDACRRITAKRAQEPGA